MKKSNIIGVVLSVFVLASCATSSDVVDGGLFQKRKYNKGWHFNKKSKIELNSSVENNLAIANEKDVDNSSIVSVVKTETGVAYVEPTVINADKYDLESSNTIVEPSPVINVENSDAELIETVLGSRKEVKKTLRSNLVFGLSDNTSNTSDTNSDAVILLIILAILLPPLAVGLYEGLSTRFWIDLLLTLLFFLPGIVYALLIVMGVI